jgi:leucyl aminopeptidase (aminopeptidase T)
MSMNTSFGPVHPELAPGARNAIEVCLAVQAGERVAIIADEESAGVAASLAAAVEAARATCDGVLLEAVATRPLTCVPQPVIDALEHGDAGILCIQPKQGELHARMQIVQIVERRRIRYAHMIGVTPQIMTQGMRTDYRLVDRLSDRLLDLVHAGTSLRVRTPGGTSFTATFDPAMEWVKTSGLINTRYWSNLPAGEVFTTPGSLDGTFVCDGTAGDYFNAKYGDLSATPMRLRIEAGRLVSIECERRDLEREFREYCHTDPHSDRVGELAFGTNIGVRDMIGVLLQDEKIPGVHIAFGDPYGSQTGANWQSSTHVDVLTRRCDVWIDDRQVIAGGKYLFGELGLEASDR